MSDGAWNPMAQRYRPTMPVITLAAFLLARIAEDEVNAHAATAAAWTHERVYDDVWSVDLHIAREAFGVGEDCRMPAYVATHIIRQSPQKTLAECEAKRRIVELADDATGLDIQVDGEFRVGTRDTTVEPYCGDLILLALALPYADHPDWREEWRP